MTKNYICSGDFEILYILENELRLSKKLIRSLKSVNGIKLNGLAATVRKIAHPGDVVSINIPEIKSGIIPYDMPLEILFEDNDILCLNKPQGISVHPDRNDPYKTLGNGVVYYYNDKSFIYRPINRLDKNTSGIVLIAKNRISANILNKQMLNSVIKKEYIAFVEGSVESGLIDAPIRRERHGSIKRIVSTDGKKAVTEYEKMYSNNGNTIVKIKLHTGRTHQIRVHFAYIGNPLVNDFLYGKETGGLPYLLHCSKLEFLHPETNEKIIIKSYPSNFC